MHSCTIHAVNVLVLAKGAFHRFSKFPHIAIQDVKVINVLLYLSTIGNLAISVPQMPLPTKYPYMYLHDFLFINLTYSCLIALLLTRSLFVKILLQTGSNEINDR